MVQIAVIICTFNRADYLQQALQSLARQTLPLHQYQIIVVDNASTDETAQIVNQFTPELPNLRYLREPRLGLSIARNAGAAMATTPYLAYLDDDGRARLAGVGGTASNRPDLTTPHSAFQDEIASTNA